MLVRRAFLPIANVSNVMLRHIRKEGLLPVALCGQTKLVILYTESLFVQQTEPILETKWDFSGNFSG
jgi:hypothetical protein